jgi:hypothetical protein
MRSGLRTILFLFLLLLAACTRVERSPYVARVDGKRLTEEDLYRRVERAAFQRLSPEEREERIMDLVKETALYLEAVEQGYARRPEVDYRVEGFQRNRYVEALIEDQVWKPVLADSTLRKIYQRMQKVVGMYHILIKYKGARMSEVERSEEEARALAYDIWEQVKTGELPFPVAALRYSEDPIVRAAQGDMGYLYYGNMVPEVLEVAAWDPNCPRYPPPIKSDMGYHLIKIKGSKTAPQKPYEEVKQDIIRLLRAGRLQEFKVQLRKLENRLQTQARVRYFDAAIESLYVRLVAWNGGQRQGLQAAALETVQVPEPLAEMEGRPLYQDWFIEQMRYEPLMRKANLIYLYDLKKFLSDAISRYLGSIEARRLHLVDEEKLQSRIEQLRRDTIVEIYLREARKQDPTLDEETLASRALSRRKVKINRRYLVGEG